MTIPKEKITSVIKVKIPSVDKPFIQVDAINKNETILGVCNPHSEIVTIGIKKTSRQLVDND